ncbi:MAG: E2-like enzyme [Vezdaea aestivalis]|nr:MAG: E2-like enzyme [Vezdaea aestivalis]
MSNSILATPLQLSSSASAQAGLDEQAISLIIHASTHLTLSAALLLKLPHSVGVHASILLQRFFTGSTGGSLRSHDAHHISAGALYLASKLSLTNAASPRDIVNTYTYLRSLEPPFFNPPPNHLDPGEYSVSEGTYQSRRQELFEAELLVLRTLGFQTLAPQPYALAVQYAQALGALEEQKGRAVARRAHAHLNTALVSPQLLFLTQLPHALAVAAVYLAAREEGVKLVDSWQS